MFGEGDNPNGFLLVYVGRISNEKKIDFLIDVLNVLRKTYPSIYLAIIGDGPHTKKYKALHGAEHHIYCQPRFLEHRDLGEVYASANLHISASEFETLGNTVLEALACGIPCIMPCTQGFQDTVKHGITGYLYTVNSLTHCVSLVSHLIQHRTTLCKTMGETGRQEMLAEHSLEYVVQEIVINWYQTSINYRAKQRTSLSLLTAYVLLIIHLPFTIFVFMIYDCLVNVLIKPLIPYLAEKSSSTTNRMSVNSNNNNSNRENSHSHNNHNNNN
jgi:glycogen synthase